jgi:hypothetical protein
MTRFKVEGSGTFPVDMLRHDGCFPHSTDDAMSIVKGRGVGSKDRVHDTTRVVELVTHHPNKSDHRLTPERWRSFGWRVLIVENPYKC